MFKTMITKIKEVLSRMGIIKRVGSLNEFKDIDVNEDFYNKIDMWTQLYKGYLPSWHDIKVHSIGGEHRKRMLSMNMPKVMSQEMASIVFNERCEVNVSNTQLQEYIDKVLDDNKFTRNFQNYLEFQFAMGGMITKPYFSDDKIKLAYLTPDSFIPISWDNSGISEAVFLYEKRKGKYRYTHFEWHLWEGKEYVIKNELYRADSKTDEIGIKVPLTELFGDLEEEVRIQDLTRSLFVYFKPNTANSIDINSPLGVPIYAHAMDTLKALDTAFDSYHREFRLGKRRIIVPTSAVRTVPDENGRLMRYFDVNDEVYQAMDVGDMDSSKVLDNTVELRVEEHSSAISSLLNMLSMQCGFSTGTFTFDGGSVKTATEVVSENSKTFRTKQSHETIIEEGLIELVDIIIQLSALYDLFVFDGEYEVSVAFDDSIAEDKTAEVAREIELVMNKLQSKKRALMKIHGITESEAEELLEEINEESVTAQANAMDMFGLNPSNPEATEGNNDDDDDDEGGTGDSLFGS